MSILDTIDLPSKLKALSKEQLIVLAEEIRQTIIKTVAKTGGHLAPSLGVVELTLALHKVFNMPEDKIIWDVGHQAYCHKIITGRRKKFNTLRQKNGLSGFPKISESEYDSFGTGHSSTSISAALGMALARDISGQNNEVIAVIGDGSLTGGQAFEALNNAGHLGTNMIVILNDNEMSIDKNVGALSEYLSQMRTAPTYNKVKHDLEFLLRKIPSIGDSVANAVERVKDSLRYLLIPGELFEDLGFTYLGPIDGHNIELLSEVLEKAKAINGPVLIHVLTQKGKGYVPAENKSNKFHGVGPFCIESGEIIKTNSKPTYTAVFSKALVNLAMEDEDIVAITAAMPEGTGLKKFGEIFPTRFFDVGIAEQHAVTVAAGLASQKKKPVLALYSTFAQRAYDQIIHDVCLQNLPVVLMLDRAGIVGEDGPTHHGVFDFSFIRHMPNVTIMAPKDESELNDMLYSALKYQSPVVIRYPRGCGIGVEVPDKPKFIEIGSSEILSKGIDVAFFAIGAMVDNCIKASQLLAARGINASVINARFVKPLDEKIINDISKQTKKLITVEDNILAGGFGSAILEYINDNNMFDVRVLRLGLPDKFIEQGKRQELLDNYNLSVEKIVEKAIEFLKD